MLLLLLLQHQSCLTLCDPTDGSPPGSPSLGFSRQEHWSGLPFLLQCMKVKSEREVAQSCPTLSNPMDCSLPGSSVHGTFQARVLEWVIPFNVEAMFKIFFFFFFLKEGPKLYIYIKLCIVIIWFLKCSE